MSSTAEKNLQRLQYAKSYLESRESANIVIIFTTYALSCFARALPSPGTYLTSRTKAGEQEEDKPPQNTSKATAAFLFPRLRYAPDDLNGVVSSVTSQNAGRRRHGLNLQGGPASRAHLSRYQPTFPSLPSLGSSRLPSTART